MDKKKLKRVMTHIIIGGGAAGYFSAINYAQNHPSARIVLLEKYQQILAKVRISGGGRCNVTHACFEPSQLVKNYPRGQKELLSPFTRFQPKDTIAWFEAHDVPLKVEEDGRMFPVTDSSETIINCLVNESKRCGVELRLKTGVNEIVKCENGFIVHLTTGESLTCESIVLATGNSSSGHALAASLGHSIVQCVPSLFTFNIPNSPLEKLSGISVEKVKVSIKNSHLFQTGPLLITHWGFSGPAILKLSAWGARTLNDLNYQATIYIHWVPDLSESEIRLKMQNYRIANPKKQVVADAVFPIPRNLWRALVSPLLIDPSLQWSSVSNKLLEQLIQKMVQDSYQVEGKTTYKQEFVTCGGVRLSEVNFKTMESRLCPGLYFAGEILDIDGITGGFNFQAAWTTGWIAAQC